MKNKALLVLRIVYALFLIGTGFMTLSFQFDPPAWPESPAGDFLMAAGQTGYLVAWIGIFKALTGFLMLLRRTEKLAYIMAIPYTVNIILWVTFVAHEWLWIGLLNFTASILLFVANFKFYAPVFDAKKQG